MGFRLKTFLPSEGGRLPGHRASDVRVRARRLVKPRLRCVRPKHKLACVEAVAVETGSPRHSGNPLDGGYFTFVGDISASRPFLAGSAETVALVGFARW